MKKYTQAIVMTLFILMIFSACESRVSTKNIATLSIETDRLYDAETLDELEGLSKYIVQGKFWDDAHEDLQSEAGIIIFGATVSSFEITKVYKGNFKEGDVIKVVEKYYVEDDQGQKTLIHHGNYMPSDVGKEYVLFFDNPPENTERWKDTYTPICVEKGRYPVLSPNTRAAVSVDDMTNEELNLDTGDSSLYREIYKDVIEKYMQ